MFPAARGPNRSECGHRRRRRLSGDFTTGGGYVPLTARPKSAVKGCVIVSKWLVPNEHAAGDGLQALVLVVRVTK